MMNEIDRLCKVVEEEIGKIADKGLNTGNLDTAYKLIDIYKDMKEAESYTAKKEYYEMETGSGEYSERRSRDSRGRYSRDEGNSYENGSSYARRGEHYVRGHYSRNNGNSRNAGYSEDGYSMDGGYSGYDRYMDSKQSYRSNKSPECKQRLMDTLEEYMDDFTKQMEEMMRDSDCQEERTTIKRYIDKIKNLS